MVRTMSKFGYFLVAAAILGGLATSSSAKSRAADKAGQHPAGNLTEATESIPDEFTGALIGSLEQRGFQVSVGFATETGNATYVGLSANDAAIMGGVPNGTLLDTELKGSADVYAPVDKPDKFSKFFVHFFASDCAVLEGLSSDCEADPVSGGSKCCTRISGMSTIGDPVLQGMIMISLRNYISPETQSGPDSSRLLTPRIITFKP